MNKNKLQNSISGSVFTLPVCTFVALVLWWLPAPLPFGSADEASPELPPYIIALALAALTTYVLIELNNVNMLIRLRTRMVSSVWLVSIATIDTMHTYSDGLAGALCITIAYYLLFMTYQRRNCETIVFHYSLMIGLASIFVPFFLAFLPCFLWYQTIFLRSTTLRVLCATLIGCIFPWLLWGGYWVYMDDYTILNEWFTQLTSYTPLDIEAILQVPEKQLISWGFTSFLMLLGVVHYLNTSYNDKIQVRMFLYILVSQFVLLETFVILQPQHLDEMQPVLLATGAPLIAHFFALTRSWFTNLLFILSVLGYCALGYYNLFWLPNN